MSLRQSNLIDLLAHDTASDEVVMTMVEPRPWDGSDQRIFELQEKVNAYLSFALDGEMLDQLPQLTGKTVRLQLDCLQEPDAKIAHIIGIIQKQIGFQGVQFSVRVIPDLPADEEHECCGGHGHAHGDEEEGCCRGHDHAHRDSPDGESGCCDGHGGCGCS